MSGVPVWRHSPGGTASRRCFTQSLAVRLRVRGSAVTGALPGVPVMMIFDRAASAVSAGAGRGRDCAVTACADVFVTETGRLTDQRVEMDEYEMARVDAELQRLQELLPGGPTASITYFVQDERKNGGSYHCPLPDYVTPPIGRY